MADKGRAGMCRKRSPPKGNSKGQFSAGWSSMVHQLLAWTIFGRTKSYDLVTATPLIAGTC
jgi:hypothetical protein